MDPSRLDQRLDALESRLARVETLLQTVSEQLGHARLSAEAARESIKSWVTDYVSLRLTQLVPETCEHVPDAGAAGPRPEAGEWPVLQGTRIRCTEEVVHRLGRIPIPFVRQMVTQKVAEAARAEGVGLVDIAFFERAATF